MEANMSDLGLTSEQRAAIAVHNATQNRMCLNLSGNGQICVACSEVADQIDAAVEVERQRSQAALAAARRELSLLATAAGRLAVLLDGTVDWDAQGEDDGIALNAVGAMVRRVGVVTPEEFRRWDYSAALAAPAAGEEGKRNA
jgi:hypothetical protein